MIQIRKNMWEDGTCECGSVVYEGPSTEKDYMNFCSNKNCKHHVPHHVFDMEESDYYIHD